MWAAVSGKSDVVTELISLGANVDIQNNVSYFYSLNTAKVKDLHIAMMTYYTQFMNYNLHHL